MLQLEVNYGGMESPELVALDQYSLLWYLLKVEIQVLLIIIQILKWNCDNDSDEGSNCDTGYSAFVVHDEDNNNFDREEDKSNFMSSYWNF